MKNYFLLSLLAFMAISCSSDEEKAASDSDNAECSVSGVGFHMGNTIAIKFNSDGRFNYSDKLMNIPKTFLGTWEQEGNKIITTNDRSTTGMGIGQQHTYTFNCDKLTIAGFTLVKD